MSDLTTTNLILVVIAGATLMQSLLLLGLVWWVRGHVAALRAQIESLDVPRLAGRLQVALDDLHAIADTASRAGRAVERTANGVHAVVDVAGQEVRRATMGLRTAFSVAAGLARRVAAAREGLRSGVREMLLGRSAVDDRHTDEAIAVLVSEGGHD